MSRSPILAPDGSIEDLDDEELLERIAALDPDEYPLAPIAKRALERELESRQEGPS
jgi:hypothetical protein